MGKINDKNQQFKNKITNNNSENQKGIQNKLDKIKSKYNLNNIFSYIKNDSFQLKFFLYSKKYQNILNLTINNYKEKYFEQNNFNILNINDFFSCYKDYTYYFIEKGGYPGYYNKDYFTEKFEKYKNIINNNSIKEYILFYLENINKNSNLKNIYLDIYSPFFDILSKLNNFSDIFIIIISIKFIKKYKLEKDYIQAFNILNKLNIKYSILFRFIDANDINYLITTFKINLKNIKKLILFDESYNDSFYEKFFLFKEFQNNLIELNITLNSTKYNQVDNELFQNINTFKSLEYLELNNIFFKSIFNLNLPGLKALIIKYCNNISLSEKMCLNLKTLYFGDFTPYQQKILKFPNLENCEFYFPSYKNNTIIYNSVIDFSSMKKLKVLKADPYDFLSIGNNILLEDLSLISLSLYNDIKIEKKIIEKIIIMKSLKKINISLNKIENNDISNIEDLNTSITSAEIELKSHVKYDLYNIQEKLPNISDLNINIFGESNVTDIDIIENNKYKIKNLTIKCIYASLKLKCQSFQNLEQISIYIEGNLDNIKNKFPFLNNNCNITFSSLTSFIFNYNINIDLDILYNLCNNLDKMKNLKNCGIFCKCKNVDKTYYEYLNEKLSLLNLDYINVDIDNDIIIAELLNDGQFEEEKNINKFKENGILIKKSK